MIIVECHFMKSGFIVQQMIDERIYSSTYLFRLTRGRRGAPGFSFALGY